MLGLREIVGVAYARHTLSQARMLRLVSDPFAIFTQEFLGQVLVRIALLTKESPKMVRDVNTSHAQSSLK